MKKLIFIGAALLLSGCSQAPIEPAEKVEPPNSAACESFSSSTARIMDIFEDTDADMNNIWSSVQSEFDSIALTADGDVKTRMLDMVDQWPSLPSVYIYGDGRTALNGMIESVARACSAEGFEISYSTYSN